MGHALEIINDMIRKGGDARRHKPSGISEAKIIGECTIAVGDVDHLYIPQRRGIRRRVIHHCKTDQE